MRQLLGSVAAIAASALIALPLGAEEAATDETAIKAQAAEIFGHNTGSNLAQQINSMGLDSDAFLKGMAAALNNEPLAMTPEQQDAVMQKFQNMMQAEANKKSAAAKEVGEQFLVEKAKEEGVQATGSGLLYKVISEGTGPKPTKNDRVRVHYRGTLVDGTQFDSSYDRGEPTTFGVGQVIKGWTEGLQLMSIGSTYEFYIPSNLAYGERGAGRQIPPGATLVFKVELLGIE